MPYPPFPFPFSYLPEGVQKQLESYNNNPYADPRMPNSMMPGSKNNPMVNPTGVPVYDEETGMEILDETAIPLSRYKLQNLPKQKAIIKDVMDTPWPELNKDFVNQAMGPKPVEYDPSTGLPIKKQFDPNALPNFGLIPEGPKVSLDILPYKDDVEYIRSQRQQEPEIKDDPEFRKKYGSALASLSPAIKLMTGLNLNNNADDGDISKLKGDYEGDPSLIKGDYEGDIGLLRSNMEGDGDMSYIKPDPQNPLNPTNPLTQTPKNKFGIPEAYYLGKSMLDATALINNMVQPEPPSIQMKNTYFERQRLNPEPYDTMRSEMRDQGTQAYRLQRENISQASDLMKGLAAVTSGTQQGLMQVGMQQAGAEQAVSNANQQISMQEQAGIAQTQNQETLTNYQNQAQVQQYKDQMVSAQLARLGDTAGAYSDYVAKKELSQKMTDLSKEQADKGNAIQLAMLKYQAGQNELNSDTFKEAQRQNINQYISETKTNLLADPRYSSLGPNYDPLTLDQRENKYKTLEQRLGILSDEYDGFSEESKPVAPVKTAEMNDEKWASVQQDFDRRKYNWERDKAAYDKYKAELDKNKPILELERQFQTELKNAYDITGRRQTFQSDWFKKRGLSTMQETIAEVETLVNPNRQIFK